MNSSEMIHEFAIDPRILNGWLVYSLLINDCGAEHGRLISDYPNRWKKMVWEAVKSNPNHTPLDEQRIQFDLQHRITAKLVASGRRYDFSKTDWLEQAEREDKAKPFRCIISDQNPRGSKHVISITELDKQSDSHWQVKRDDSIDRSPEALASIARPLFAISNQIKIIDPHFAPEMPRYRKSLKELLRGVSDCNPRIRSVEIHLKYGATREFFTDTCKRELPKFVPRGLNVQLFRWKQRVGGDQLHARYILTDRVGIWVEAGLDAGGPGEQTDVGLLTELLRQKRWDQFDKKPGAVEIISPQSAFDFEDEVIIAGSA